MSGGVDVETIVREVIDANLYMVLGTTDEAGDPWVSPVFYGARGARDFYWISSPEVTHSRNLAKRPHVSIVIFDSRAPIGTGGSRAVYMAAFATEVGGGDLEDSLEFASATFGNRGARELTSADLLAPAPYRLYRATATEHFVLCPRSPGEPCEEHGFAYDHRTQVDLALPRHA